MPYRFVESDRNVEAGLRRIALQQIDRGLAELDRDDLDRAARVHQLRKRMKKLRGLIRLVRPGFADYAAENAAIRDAARRLSGQRDSDVLLATHDALVTETRLDADGLAALRADLTRAAPQTAGPADDALPGFRDDLLALRDRAERWQVSGKGRKKMIAGMEKTLSRARKAMRKAQDSGDDAALHDWRKRVKYHWYHCRLLTPIRPEPMAQRAEMAAAVGADLGDHHDLSVYLAWLDDPDRRGHDLPLAADLRAAALDRQAALAARALGTGARLFDAAPRKTAKRWSKWWRAWRRAG